jgi:hypothetical protein
MSILGLRLAAICTIDSLFDAPYDDTIQDEIIILQLASGPRYHSPPMDQQEIIDSVESRALRLHMSMAKVCREANVSPPSWSRAKTKVIGYRLLGKIEGALDRLEAARRAA